MARLRECIEAAVSTGRISQEEAQELARRIDEIDQRIRELQTYRERFEANRARCQAARVSSCPVVLDLVEAVSGPYSMAKRARLAGVRSTAGHTL